MGQVEATLVIQTDRTAHVFTRKAGLRPRSQRDTAERAASCTGACPTRQRLLFGGSTAPQKRSAVKQQGTRALTEAQASDHERPALRYLQSGSGFVRCDFGRSLSWSSREQLLSFGVQ